MAKCKKCGEQVATDIDLCPSCGTGAGAAETLSDFPRVDFKAARKKLKEEIIEAKEKREE